LLGRSASEHHGFRTLALAPDTETPMEANMTATRDFLNDLTSRTLIPNRERLAEIAARGDVAVAVHDVGSVSRDCLHTLGEMGWNGKAAVFRLSRARRKRIAAATDSVTARWLGRSRGIRIFVVSGAGSLLVNNKDGAWSLEPGSLDREMQAAVN
jgi:hypothetical protein